MDRSIIERARERARIAGSALSSPAAKGYRSFPASRAERTRAQTNADYLLGRLQHGLATDEESNLYWACGLLFVMGVLLARSDTHVSPNHGVTTGEVCHGYI